MTCTLFDKFDAFVLLVMPAPAIPAKKRTKADASASESITKKKRCPNPTVEEKEALLSYMERHSHYAQGRLNAPNARKKMKEMHGKLAERIREVDPSKRGPDRDGETWWKVSRGCCSFYVKL